MSTFNDLIAESPRVKREMKRLRKLHGVYEKALQLAAKDAGGDFDEYLRRAATIVPPAAPAPV
jgi:hypothetical protein